MAKPKKAISPTAISRELTTLKQRVKWLEAALKPKRDKPAVNRSAAGSSRETAEREARHKALSEYYAKCREDRLRKSPWMLRSELEWERDTNEFLKSRGFKPNPSTIPKSLRRKARNPREEPS